MKLEKRIIYKIGKIIFIILIVAFLCQTYFQAQENKRKINHQTEIIKLIIERMGVLVNSNNKEPMEVDHSKHLLQGHIEETSQAWRALEVGMTKEQVEGLLGEPSKVTVLRGNQAVWFYPQKGMVVFIADTFYDAINNTHSIGSWRLSSWLEPNW